jgi:uncharacterized cupredoxin-like copper-binding protein
VQKRAALAVALFAMAPLVVACGPDKNDSLRSAAGLDTAGSVDAASGGPVPTTPDSKISGDEREYAIHVTSQVAKAGKVTITMTNYGTVTHEMLIVKTDLAPGQIKIGADGKFNEEDPAATVLDEISEYEPGASVTKTFDLAPGKYQLVCNIPNHYSSGMYIPFEVVK